MSDGPTILVIDNYDSFVYILVQYLGELGAQPVVHRHDDIDVDGIFGSVDDVDFWAPPPGNAGCSRPPSARWRASRQ